MTHPVTPPPELVQQWLVETLEKFGIESHYYIATRAAQWGADQELEECSEWTQGYAECGDSLRAARRPKPPSLKEQALTVLESVAVHELYGNATADNRLSADDMKTIRRAIEALPDE